MMMKSIETAAPGAPAQPKATTPPAGDGSVPRAARRAPFQGVDYYDLSSLLSDEERMARDTVRRFVDEQVLPVIEE
ncbi:MAG: hypothetical protein ABR599_09820, partial [Gemmatimonadota bacterium]